jgi:hypothetical protein
MSQYGPLYKGQEIYINSGLNGFPLFTSSYESKNGIPNTRKRWPVYRKYRVTNAETARIDRATSGSFELVDSNYYWNPFQKDNPQKFIRYNADDEFINWDSRRTSYTYLITEYDVRTQTGSLPGGAKIPDFGPGSFIKIESGSGLVIYKSTDKFSPFSQLGYFGANPYQSNNIRLWVRVSGGSLSKDTGAIYWYHPVTRQMHLVPQAVVKTLITTTISVQLPGGSVKDTFYYSMTLGKIIALRTLGGPDNIAAAEILERNLNLGISGNTGGGNSGSSNATGVAGPGGGSESGSATSSTSEVSVVTRIRGNYGFVSGAQPEGSDPQMVQYYSFSTSGQPEVSRHFFKPKPNEISYDNLGSEWTEIERSGRMPLLDWKNFRLMKVSFSFLVLPDDTYRTGAFGETADDGITLSIDDKLEQLRSMAARPFPVTLFGFDGLITNPNPYSFSEGSGVQFIISDLRISSMIRTPSGRINRATCEISLQELPIEYSQIITMPKLPLIGRDPSSPASPPNKFGDKLRLAGDLLNEVG